MRKVTILGASGSIGQNTLDVIRSHPDDYAVFAITANRSVDLVFTQCLEFTPRYAVMVDAVSASELAEKLSNTDCKTEVLAGTEALEEVAGHDDVDIVMAAIVGAAGLLPTLAAVKKGKRVLLANKEALVMSGKLFMDAVSTYGAELLPIDSEHNAIFQALPSGFQSLGQAGVRKILLTGSGGPFRSLPVEELEHVTVEQAVTHPNWSMGKKISVDSATMMNKGLEFIEACWLFKAQPEAVEIVVHPQSIVHSMVEYVDGSVLAQMGTPDMRIPIANCMGWPNRISSNAPFLNFYQMSDLSFEEPDLVRFPCLSLAVEAMKSGGTYSIALNAANEIAVDAFLNQRIKFTDIYKVLHECLDSWETSEPDSLGVVLNADKVARSCALQACQQITA